MQTYFLKNFPSSKELQNSLNYHYSRVKNATNKFEVEQDFLTVVDRVNYASTEHFVQQLC